MRESRDLVGSWFYIASWLIECGILSFSGLVDLPKENLEAAYNAITLPEEFHDFDPQNMK